MPERKNSHQVDIVLKIHINADKGLIEMKLVEPIKKPQPGFMVIKFFSEFYLKSQDFHWPECIFFGNF
jgi:hypothetical protein